MTVAVKPYFVIKSLASSAKGMRWPMPGIASMAMCGAFALVPFSMERYQQKKVQN
jgi:hypothetical protein